MPANGKRRVGWVFLGSCKFQQSGTNAYFYPPKAEVARSNRVGSANISNNYGKGGKGPSAQWPHNPFLTRSPIADRREVYVYDGRTFLGQFGGHRHSWLVIDLDA